jgi:hypothetical protein
MDARLTRTGSWLGHHRIALWIAGVVLLFLLLAITSAESAGGFAYL